MRKVNCIEGNLFTIGLAADPSCFLISYHTLTMRSCHMTCSPSHMCTLYLTSVCIAGKDIHKQNQNNPLPSEDERFSASSLIQPYVRSWTPVVSMVSELKQNSPSSSSPSLLRFSPLPGPPPPLLSPFIFSFLSSALSFFFHSSLMPQRPLLQLPLIVPLQTAAQCRWTYSPCPLHTRTCALTNRSRAAEWSSCRGD